MPAAKPNRKAAVRKRRLAETIAALTALQFGPKQRNETAAYTLLALLDLQPDAAWADAQAPLRGITPIIDFIATAYGIPNTFSNCIAMPLTESIVEDAALGWFGELGHAVGHGPQLSLSEP